MWKRIGLTLAGLVTAVGLLAPQVASARDRDDYRYGHSRYQNRGRSDGNRLHRQEERRRLQELRRESRARRYYQRNRSYNRPYGYRY